MVTKASGSTIGNVNPIRYRGYYYDVETGLYYLWSRYYDPRIGRFISSDTALYVGPNCNVLGYNTYAYCLNNPVNYADPFGRWTFGISISTNLTFFLGVSVSIGLFFDDNRNFDLQFSYSIPGTDDTSSVGLLDYGIGVTFQETTADTVYDLYGPSTAIGGSVGDLVYLGYDVISLSGPDEYTGQFDGSQFTIGVGVGVDVHVVTSNTVSLFNQTKNVSLGTGFIRRTWVAMIM